MAQLEALPAVTKPRVGRTADPCVMVIFGFTGDLTRRKLVPALYNLASQQLLSREFAVIGVGRSPMSNDDARKKLTEDFKQFATGAIDNDLGKWWTRGVNYVVEISTMRPPTTSWPIRWRRSTRNVTRTETISSI